jgi:hypothetical protein
VRTSVLAIFLTLACLPRIHGAGPPSAPPISSPADAVVRALADAKTLPPALLCCTRYLWVAAPSKRFRVAEKLRINLMSRYSEIVDFVEVEPWLWRLRLDEPRWDPGTWERALDTDVFFHFTTLLAKDVTFLKVWPGGRGKDGQEYRRQRYTETVRAGRETIVAAPWLPAKEIALLRELLWSEAPVLMAEWLFANSSRQRNLLNDDNSGIGYYDWLGLKDRNDYFQLIDPRADFLRASEIFGREFLAALDKSGISPQNRQILRKQARGGGGWVTLDTNVQRGRGVAVKNLRLPDLTGMKKAGRFLHNTEEWITPLPNALPVYFLSDDKGVRQNVAPGDTHGLHDGSTLNESNSKTLHILISCLQCHHPNVLKTFTDDVRRKYKAGGWTFPASTDPKIDLEFRRILLSDVYTQLADDEALFVRAFAKATTTRDYPLGLEVKEAVRTYARQWHSYGTDEVTLEQAARELGVRPAYWLRALRNYARPVAGGQILADSALDEYLQREPGGLSRLTWEDSYSFAQEILAQERARTKRGKP